MLVAKHYHRKPVPHKFENYVNYAGSKTNFCTSVAICEFENYVNYAGSKTVDGSVLTIPPPFENYVNYAGSKTKIRHGDSFFRLRTM